MQTDFHSSNWLIVLDTSHVTVLLWFLSYRNSYKSRRNHQLKHVIFTNAKITCYHNSALLYSRDCSPGLGGQQSPSLGRGPASQSNPFRCLRVSLRHGNNNYLLVCLLIEKVSIDIGQVYEYPYSFHLIMTILNLFKKENNP